MKLIVRTRNILFSPKTEWARIEQENDPPGQLLTSYLLWIALIPAVASFIGYGLIGFRISIFSSAASLNWGIKMAIQQYISIIGGVYLTAFVFNILAPNFGAQKNFPKAFQLVAYCYTAICIGGIFYIHWKLSFLAGLTGLYGLYILYLGIRPMMKIPEEKAGSYYIVILLCMIGISISLSIILGSIFGIRTLIF